MVTVHVYIEGGGDSKEQHVRLREAFSKLFQKAGLHGRMPKPIACGGREQTFNRFQTAIQEADRDKYPMLLVDSEDPVEAEVSAPDGAWEHLAKRDRWVRPKGMVANQVQLMTTCMETWIVADRATLRELFPGCLRENALPAQDHLESYPGRDIQKMLADATRDCGRDRMYRKGRRSFQLVARLDPAVLREHLPHFKRLLDSLNHRVSIR